MKKIFSFLFLLLVFGLFFAMPVLAQSGTVGPCTNPNGCGLTNPLGASTTIQSMIGRAINSVLGVVGSLALLMFVFGGLTWMTSAGSQEKVKKGRDIIVWSAIGLVVIFSAYALTKFIITTLAK
jgi:hypothetical protein